MPVNIVVGTNSYISLADADEYFTARLHSDLWNTAATDEKAQALITATRQIDRLPFRGVKRLSNQALAFPRSPNNDVPWRVLDAVCEEALAILKGIPKRLELQAQGVQSFTIGNLTEVYKPGGRIKLISREAGRLLRPFLIGSVRIT
jgi:hypothetical protein